VWAFGRFVSLNWGFSMGKFEQSAIVAVCGVSEEIVIVEREKQRNVWRRKRENGEKRNVGLVTVIKLGPT
jgi:hypothetical protein